MRRSRALWVLIGVAVLLGLAITLASVLGRSISGTSGCDRGLGHTDCPVQAETIEALTKMDLPEGTTIESSSYSAFQDWHLTASFVIPADGVAAWEASLNGYGKPGTECFSLPNLAPEQVCASTPGEGASGVSRYARVDRGDGSVKVAVEAFGG